ncbi:MAG: glutamine--tRNA ligase [Candidatus Dactylopiibacterium carminicum]|uniref:Glutamine--tRNA ligase n=1 Tax=Candidatus Dactylopiibacterium carminicum TaxID=857335 RepID=A0A272EU86_9RHOO|nr:glutamine--tRNA ligase/YqeY domain fusion protein [Candidatus Dactylopiibacterium carminicum]KAF7599735.1 glutamine--tRNA ligase/YqeY domain fusion protein [Candidatus Dactylopiibacterium carminicum]PAS93671.1 MAG: glutamine--tRNA ligase [Candidatus Dactylopiibacterium carminicum]PAS97539.1 MAG: glutamine--tRNA ligase [Candidatus Dactylopiibacterium carminicum]PAS99737.1 MAG: glutamine--tRNA ligase [Candidatus Dactylopiibacterium carminicum]
MSTTEKPAASAATPTTNFLRNIIEAELAEGKFVGRGWAGQPGEGSLHAAAPLDPAKIRTRFPPEPNGYLHVGHAKSICLNFGLARDFGGVCHMRFDDTNPEKEEQEYVDSILDAVRWLGFSWDSNDTSHLFYASNYFDFMYHAAELLIERGHAYVDQQSADEMRATRGTLTEPGQNSPWRDRPVEENLRLFREMREGKHTEGSLVLRAKVDMASPNINLRDPAIYRIRFAEHHNTGNKWCIYPMYTFAHPIEDALERITHSICTLEFEDQRPFYDWLLAQLRDAGMFADPLPRQIEFARMNLTYVITSKRKLMQLVNEKHVDGWDDPRMPTIVGLRRRGYTPASLQMLAERTGASKSNSWIDFSVLEGCLREDLEEKAARGMVVLDPLRLRLTNWDALFGADHVEPCTAPVHPHHEEMGVRKFNLTPEIWIEREDFQEIPEKGFRRLYPPRTDANGAEIAGNMARLKYGYVIRCTGCEKDADGKIVTVLAEIVPDTKSGTPGADSVKVKGVITWVSAFLGLPAEIRLYDRLFTDPQPDAGGKNFLDALNPEAKRIVQGWIEPSLAQAMAGASFQFERHGYFVADRIDHTPGKPVFNRTTTLKDSWGK